MNKRYGLVKKEIEESAYLIQYELASVLINRITDERYHHKIGELASHELENVERLSMFSDEEYESLKNELEKRVTPDMFTKIVDLEELVRKEWLKRIIHGVSNE